MILRTSLRPELDVELVTFHGELDAATAPDLGQPLGEVVAMPRGALLIDLCDCTFIDSLGVATVVRAAKGMRERDRPLAVATSSPQVRRVLALTGADEILDVLWSREDAINRLSSRLGQPDR
jgi:anti-sigma B factor antagonist